MASLRGKRTPREGAGPLPVLLLDKGQLPDLLPAPLGRNAPLKLRRVERK